MTQEQTNQSIKVNDIRTMKNFPLVLATAIIFAVFGWFAKSKNKEIIKEQVKYVYTKDSIQYVPQPEIVIRTNWMQREILKIDTIGLDKAYIDSILSSITGTQLAYVADDYFKKRFYSDTLGDSTYTLVLKDSVYMNSIVWKSHNISVRHKETTVVKPERGYLSFGVFGGANEDYYNLGGAFGFTTKNKLYLGYGFSPIGMYHTINISKRLSFKK